MTFKLPLSVVLLLGLTACGNDPEIAAEAEGANRRAEGRVLGGTISDEMLQLDRVRSTAPLAEPTAEPGEAEAAVEDAPEEPEGSDEAEASPEPEETSKPAAQTEGEAETE